MLPEHSGLARFRGAFLFIVALERKRQDPDIREAEDEHAPIHEAIEGARIVVQRKPTAPVREAAATQKTHHRGAKHAAVTHASHHAADDDYPKCTRLYRFSLHLTCP